MSDAPPSAASARPAKGSLDQDRTRRAQARAMEAQRNAEQADDRARVAAFDARQALEWISARLREARRIRRTRSSA